MSQDTSDIPVPEKPGSYQQLLEMMTPQIHARFKTAIELGKWENGERLSTEQRDACMQAVIAWDHQHLQEAQRVAFIDRRKLQKTECDDDPESSDHCEP